MILGLISDTHGLLRAEALEALRGSDAIIHAGDVGRKAILEQLGRIAPVTAVRGNVDVASEFDVLPQSQMVEFQGVWIHVLHDVHAFRRTDPRIQIVVSGHSHKPLQETREGILFVNPGSAGPRRFKLPIGVCKLDLGQRPWRAQFITLAGK